jgi:hypothetical protein
MQISSFDDPDYIVQGCYSGDYGTVCESTGSDNEAEAVKLALRMVKSPIFAGDYVRVISRDGELVFYSRGEHKCPACSGTCTDHDSSDEA